VNLEKLIVTYVVSYIQLPVTSLLQLRTRFNPTQAYVEFFGGQMALGQDYPPPFIVPPMLHHEGLAH
jgi:hypothetical protein